ncbi:MAG: glycine cleavage system protein T, partial [Betaproteobacteria bacterium]|nr:glycine cleavage system protein T [Betaproteobacteria bacterium]
FCERVESGLVSYGGDTDGNTNPFEVRMGKYVDLDVADDVVGIQALRRIKQEGVQRQQLGVLLDGDQPVELGFHWHPIYHQGQRVGDLTNCVWSWRLKRNIGFGLVASACAVGDLVEVQLAGKPVTGTLSALPFI